MLTSTVPLRVAVLCSRRAPGLLHLLQDDPHHRSLYEVVCVVTSEPDFAESAAVAEAGVDVVHHPIAAFYAERASSVYRDFVTRRAYDRETVAQLQPYAPDLVLLDGYLYLVTRPMLDAFRGRMLNLHFSDLQIRQPDGRPTYAGIRAVRDALRDGRTETCATVHVVTEEPDGGPPIVRSAPFAVSPLVGHALAWGAEDMFKAYAYAHQEWMIRAASGQLLAAALDLVASGRLALDTLAGASEASELPWLTDSRGRLLPPASRGICERLWGYQREIA